MHLEFKFPPVDPVPLGDEYQDLNYTGRYGKVSFTIKWNQNDIKCFTATIHFPIIVEKNKPKLRLFF